MPSAQVIDRNPQIIPREDYSPLEKTLQSFSQRFTQNQQENRDTDALREIYGRYQQDGENIQQAFMDIQTAPGISPTARVNATKDLLAFQTHNAQLQKDQKAQLDAAEKKVLDQQRRADLENRRGLRPGELDPYEGDFATAERVTRPPKDKAAVGGLGGTPLTHEESTTIDRVLKENPDATAEELEVAFGRAGVVPGRIGNLIESRRAAEKVAAKNKTEEQKTTRQEELAFHKESEKYDDDLRKSAKVAKNQLQTVEHIKKTLDKGNVKPSNLANIFKGLGTIGDKVANALLKEDAASIQASIPGLLEGWKEIFGVRLSDADLRVLQDKLPDASKNPESNKAILNVLKKYAKISLLRSNIASEIKEKNKGLRPLGYADQVEKRFDEMTKIVKIRNPRTGNVLDIPAYEASAYINDGGELVDE